MANALDLRRRIRGVKNIQKITQAMKMVAAVRLRKAQERVKESMPYYEGLTAALSDILLSGEDIASPLFLEREPTRTGYIVIGADKGLAGSYNSNLAKAVQRHIAGHNVGLMVVGRKARDYFQRRKVCIDQAYTGISERPDYQSALEITAKAIGMYLAGNYDKVYIIYTRFCSPAVQQVVSECILPVSLASPVTIKTRVIPQIYEPSLANVLEAVATKWIEAVVYRGLVNSAASEVASRLNAMSLATENAQDLISQLVLEYNKVRQANITREISEIVGGAEALR
jgi:F-type H+-transporting ATPase subunit gamma